MLNEESTLDDDVMGMLERVSKQHRSFRGELKAVVEGDGGQESAKMNTLAMVEIAHQLAYANTLKGIELLVMLEGEGDEPEEEEGDEGDGE